MTKRLSYDRYNIKILRLYAAISSPVNSDSELKILDSGPKTPDFERLS